MKNYINQSIIEKNIRVSCKFIFSLLGTIGIVSIYQPNSKSIGILLFLFLIFIYKYAEADYKKKSSINVFSIIYSNLLSIFFVIGLQLDLCNQINWSLLTIRNILFCFLAFYPVVYLLLDKVQHLILSRKDYNEKKMSLISFSIIFIFSLLVYLAVFPGIWGYDSIFEYKRVATGAVDTAYSVVYTYILGASIIAGEKVFNSVSIGYGIYIFLQMLLMTYVSNKVVMYVYNKTKSMLLYCISIAFFSFNIFYKILINSSTQDVIYSAICMLMVLNLFKFITKSQEYFSRKHNAIELLFLTVLLCLTRNNGIAVIIFTIIFILFVKQSKKRKVKILSLLVGGVVVYYIISGPIYNIMGIRKSGISTREISSIPTQQLARALVFDKDNMSDDIINEYKKYYFNIDELIKWHKINPSISDNLKKQLNSKSVNGDLWGYIRLWLKVGKNHKRYYVEALGLQTIGLWVPNKSYPDARAYHPIVEYDNVNTKVALRDKKNNYLAIDRESKLKIYDKFLNYLVYESNWTKVPIYSFILGQSFYFHTMIIMIGISILRRENKYIIALSPIISTEFMMFFSPVSLYRYIFPVVMAFPLMLMVIMDKKLSKKKIKNKFRRGYNGKYISNNSSIRARR